MSATSPAKHCALPDAWIEKIFATLSAFYGNKFSDMWSNTNIDDVRAVWADRLGGFIDKPWCIKYALDNLDGRQWPPTLPEFISDCRRAPAPVVRQLEHKLSDEEMAHNRARLAAIAEKLGRSMTE